MNERVGRCYELAFKKAASVRSRGEAVLIHGVIRDTYLIGRGAVICHAWVEHDGMAWEPISQVEISIDAFMRMYDAEVIHRYTAREAVCMALDTGHSGPWAEMPEGIQKTLGDIEAERVV